MSKVEEEVVVGGGGSFKECDDDNALAQPRMRLRANTSDCNITPVRIDSERVSVIAEDAIEYTSRSAGVVPGILLENFTTNATASGDSDDSDDDSCESKPRVPDVERLPPAPGCTYLLRFQLSEAAKWRGERCLFNRGNQGAQFPGVFVVGPYATLRIRTSPQGSSAPVVSPFGAVRGRGGRGLRSCGRGSLSPTAGGKKRGTSLKCVTINSNPERALSVDHEVHLAVIVTPTEMRYYMDGELQKAVPISVSDFANTSSGDLTVSRNSQFEGVPCRVRDFDVISRALSDEEVAKEFAARVAEDATTVAPLQRQ